VSLINRQFRAAQAAVVSAVVVLGMSVAAAPAQAATTTARSLLSRVSVAAESNSGYDRANFQGWIDANHDCQNTRHEVLISETRVTPTYSSRGCTVTRGKWVSRWDNRTWTNPLDVDIDHHVPLAEAWGSGARRWSAGDRGRYANDLYGPALNAMTDNLNSSKQAKDPAQWLPPYAASRCTYATYWVQVKYRWRLTMDSAERTALSRILSGSCGSRAVTIPARAR
jgi:hypothetical protein